MAVQFADKALDEWLTKKIKEYKELYQYAVDQEYSFEYAYLQALKDTQKQLHAFWGSSLAKTGKS